MYVYMYIHLPLEGWSVAIRSIGDHIVDEWKMVLNILGGPVSPVEVEQALVSTWSQQTHTEQAISEHFVDFASVLVRTRLTVGPMLD